MNVIIQFVSLSKGVLSIVEFCVQFKFVSWDQLDSNRIPLKKECNYISSLPVESREFLAENTVFSSELMQKSGIFLDKNFASMNILKIESLGFGYLRYFSILKLFFYHIKLINTSKNLLRYRKVHITCAKIGNGENHFSSFFCFFICSTSSIKKQM